MASFNDSDDEFLDDDGYESHSFDEDYGNSDDDEGDEPTIKCPQCGFEMLEICHQCPRCGEIPGREFRRTSSQPAWVVITAATCLGLLLWWLLRSLSHAN